MALVKCPECGREKVSDSADMCPDCGYGVKAHFDKIKEEELRRQQQEDLESLYKNKEYEEYEINRLEEELANEKKVKAIVTVLMILGMSIGTAALMFNDHGSLGLLIVFGYGVAVFCIAGLVMSFGSVEEMEKNLRIAKADFSKYKRDMANWNRAEQIKEEIEERNKIECPYCHSKNTKKISAVSKAGSVAVYGVLAAGKISKQWHCNNCKSDF